MDAFSKYIKEQMTSKIVEFHALSDLNIDVSKFAKNITIKQVMISLVTDFMATDAFVYVHCTVYMYIDSILLVRTTSVVTARSSIRVACFCLFVVSMLHVLCSKYFKPWIKGCNMQCHITLLCEQHAMSI